MYLREYEMMFIAKPETEEATIDAIGTRLTSALEGSDGVRLHLHLWGRKRLAYEIEDFQKGLFYLFTFLGEPAAVTEVEKELKFDENILRYMTTKLSDRVEGAPRREQAEAEEAAIAAKKARDEEEARRAAEEKAEWERKAKEARAAEAAPAEAPAEKAPAKTDKETTETKGEA